VDVPIHGSQGYAPDQSKREPSLSHALPSEANAHFARLQGR